MEILQEYEHHAMTLRVIARAPDDLRGAKVSSRRDRRPVAPEIQRLETSPEGGVWHVAARIAGRNVAYVFVEFLLRDPDEDRYYGPVVREHVRAERRAETRGIGRPVWDDPIEISVRMEPRMLILTDGSENAFCFAAPEGYETLEKRVGGFFTPSGRTAPLHGLCVFDGAGSVRRMLAYRERGLRSMPRAFLLRGGDRFTPGVRILEPSGPSGGWVTSSALSNPLTVGDGGLRVTTDTLVPGDYAVGIVVQDLDGGFVRRYVPVAIG